MLTFKQLLANCFRNLYKREQNSSRAEAEEEARKTFSVGLVKVLDTDAPLRRFGFGGGFSGRTSPRFGGSGFAGRNSPAFGQRPNEFPALGGRPSDSGRTTPSSGFRPSDRMAPPQGPQSGRSTPANFRDARQAFGNDNRDIRQAFGQGGDNSRDIRQTFGDRAPPTGPANFNFQRSQQPPTGPRGDYYRPNSDNMNGRSTPAGPWGNDRWR